MTQQPHSWPTSKIFDFGPPLDPLGLLAGFRGSKIDFFRKFEISAPDLLPRVVFGPKPAKTTKKTPGRKFGAQNRKFGFSPIFMCRYPGPRKSRFWGLQPAAQGRPFELKICTALKGPLSSPQRKNEPKSQSRSEESRSQIGDFGGFEPFGRLGASFSTSPYEPRGVLQSAI